MRIAHLWWNWWSGALTEVSQVLNCSKFTFIDSSDVHFEATDKSATTQHVLWMQNCQRHHFVQKYIAGDVEVIHENLVVVRTVRGGFLRSKTAFVSDWSVFVRVLKTSKITFYFYNWVHVRPHQLSGFYDRDCHLKLVVPEPDLALGRHLRLGPFIRTRFCDDIIGDDRLSITHRVYLRHRQVNSKFDAIRWIRKWLKSGQVELELTDAEIELTLLQMGRDRSYRLSAAN